MILKPCDEAIEPGEYSVSFYTYNAHQSFQCLPSNCSSSRSYCTSIGSFSLHILPRIFQIHLPRSFSYPIIFQPLPLTIPVMPKGIWTCFSLHITSYSFLLPGKP